ncbi:snRNA-activating protein complex subunit 4 [Carlito syrichta]|uniref:snRNA-activating protein complex subunit 4 n=1 Tax=Carlito syrichta TaxID=1868482 RepID=A0A3Q0DLE6_CARSF|nr:snRNA-activating protein complex subunit 4 [Carlito syrichta]
MDIDAKREKITQEIEELERILEPGSTGIHEEFSESSLDSDSEADSLPAEDLEAAGALISEEERWGEASNDEDDPKDRALPEDPETCLQLNMVYQEVLQERLAEVGLLLAQNREQQEEITWDLAGSKGPKVKESKNLPPNMYIGHFMRPYFKDKVTGVGPPANEDAREKATQGIKGFEELLVTKWKSWEKALLRKSVVSARLQRLLQPKLLKLEYLQQKQSRVSSEPERQVLEKQIREAEKEVQDISQLPEEALLGNRLDSHDWEKISNVNFEGGRRAEDIRKFWQNSEHPSINKQAWSEEEVARLQAIAATHGHLEWQKVAEELGTSRSAFQCLQKFQQHNKALKRKEWTEEEDHMLTQLVQEMRVGSHIPYRKIVYYMEGRDSMQLIYRWTKSLDPSLKKGLWAPEEDAKLLQAVAKYGEQYWFKIREEVPGRSDAQCRDRYLRRLHFSLKKGRWDLKEEEQLTELIRKYGAGHWAKIASELPHRSGSQCLSKWRIMAGKKQSLRRRRRRPRHSVQWSSSSSSSSSRDSSGDSSRGGSGSSSSDEVEQEPAWEGSTALLSPQYMVPDIDLWIPARQSASQPRRGGTKAWLGCPAASPSPPEGASATQEGGKETSTPNLAPREIASQAQAPSGTHSAMPKGIQDSCLADIPPASSKEPAFQDGKHSLKVPLETVLRVLRTNTAMQRRTLKEKLKKLPLHSSSLGAIPSDNVAQAHVRRLWHGTFQNGQQHWRRALQRRLLDRRLLLAVTPWVGDITLPCTQAPQRPTAMQTRADGLREQLQHTHLASTPVFTLFIQLFQIDAAGCMEVVRERKAQLPGLLQAGARDSALHLLQAPSGVQSTPGCLSPDVPAREATKSTRQRGSRGLEASRTHTPPQALPPAPHGPRPKPKTVSELLREKRLREACARKAAQGPTLLPPQLLVSSPVILPPAPHGSSAPRPAISDTVCSRSGASAAGGSSTAGSWQERGTSAQDERPSTQQALALVPASMGTQGTAPDASRTPALSPSQGPVSCPLRGPGQSQAPATARKQGLPEALPFLPATPSPTPLPARPLSLTHGSGPHVAASVPLPVTWVLTAQGLLPVPTMVGLPRPAGTPEPTALLLTPVLPPADTRAAKGPQQILASTDAGPNPFSRTDPSASPTHSPSQNPAEVDCEVAFVPGEAQGAGERSGPRTCHSAEHPAASEKGALALGLLSLESEAATREWLRGRQGVCVPPLGNRLPYQPPSLCSLRALSGLLLHKKTLECKAASLRADGVAGGEAEPQAGSLQASLALARWQLRDSPAYLLLKARFLAAFTLPALLATLPPHGVPTTLSAATRVGSESEGEDEDLAGEPGLADGDAQLGCTVATSPVQRALDPGEGSAPFCWGASEDLDADDLDVLRTRRTRHIRKRRRLV